MPAGAEWWASPGVERCTLGERGVDTIREVRAEAESAGGSLVVMAAPDGVRRELGAWGSPPATLELMRRLKDAFDPHRVLNPGRFVV